MADRTPPATTFQGMILELSRYWANFGCVLAQPFDIEKGAGTFNPHTFLRALGPEPWRVAYVEPSRRPTDGRYGDNPNRLYRHHQFQVILKPNPSNVQEIYLESMRAIGIHPEDHDIRFVEDNWESPTLGAWGLGWEVWVDGMELTQFTYFQQCGGLECRPVSAELTYGLERIAMYLQGKDTVYDLVYAPGISYGDVFHRDEYEYSKFAFEELDAKMYQDTYEACESEVGRLIEAGLVIPAYDHLLKAAHAFNSLDARGAISVTERQGYILRIRDLAKACADGYLEVRESLGYPLLKDDATIDVGQTLDRSISAPKGAPRTEDLFIEIGCEELPAAEVMPAVHALRDRVIAALDEARLAHGDAVVYATPRRLVLSVPQVADRQEDRTVEVSGPPVRAAFKDGEPTMAAVKFAEKQGLTVGQLGRKDTKKGEYLLAIVEEKGQGAVEILERTLEKTIATLPFKKTMRWGTESVKFSRPIQWIVALFGNSVVPVHYAGVRAGRQSRGHRFSAPAPFTVDGIDQYLRELAVRHVVVDPEKRKALIVEAADSLAASVGGKIVEDPHLLDEITQLVENPLPLLNHFDERFLEVPREVLISEMQHHQRYLPIADEAGKLLPNFVVVTNTKVDDVEVSLNGYRRVLAARFEDGAFFFNEDKKTPLFEKVERLKPVRFHRSLGSIYDKVERVVRMAFWLAGALGPQLEVEGAPEDSFTAPSDLFTFASGAAPTGAAERFKWALARSAFLAKADLTTKMVFEFPDLQGVMGAHYARAAGEPTDVALAVEEHYLPRGADDELPTEALGAIVGLADRLDSIAGIFSVGKGPSGSADPFGLRRAAIATITILESFGWHLSLSAAIAEAIRGIGALRKKDEAEAQAEVSKFFRGRLRGVITGRGAPADVAEAVLTADANDARDALDRAQALATLRSSPDFEPIAITFKRVANILKGQSPQAIARNQLEDDAERVVFDAAGAVEARVAKARQTRDFAAAFGAIAELRPTVDQFFLDVMVMAEDEAVRARRVGLVAKVHNIFAPLADFTKLS